MELNEKENDLEHLEGQISHFKKKMVTTADTYGRDSLNTLKESQALDNLILEYMRRKRKIS